MQKLYKDVETVTDGSILLNCIDTCDDCSDILLYPVYLYDEKEDVLYKLCKDCFNEVTFCDCCDRIILYYSGESYETVDCETVCNDCFAEDFFKCDICGKFYKRNDELNEYGAIYYCNDCFNDEFGTCHNCGDTYHYEDLTEAFDGRYYCTDCYNDIFTSCDECGEEIYLEGNYSGEDDCYLCESCCETRRQEDEEENNIRIHRYGYKPKLKFHTCDKILSSDSEEKNLFMGIELEVDGQNVDNQDFLEENNSLTKDMPIYFCHDGSLDNGFEVITHPCTLNFHKKKVKYNEFFKKLIQANYQSHDYKTCGLHVHINKSYLGYSEDEKDINISKILIFYERNWNNIIKFSRRTKNQYSRWCKNYCHNTGNHEEIKSLLNQAKKAERYYAVNLCNHATVEFRIFRGTLKLNTFYASLEFVHSTVNFIKSIPLDEHYRINWNEYIKYVQDKNEYGKYQELLAYLEEKNLVKIELNQSVVIKEEEEITEPEESELLNEEVEGLGELFG